MNFNKEDYKDVWAYLSTIDGKITKPSLELLAAARKVADKLNQKAVGIIVGKRDYELAKRAIHHGADKVILVNHDKLQNYLCLPYTSALTQLCLAYKPYIFLFIADEIGKELGPRLAYRLKTGLAADNIELDIGDYYNPQNGTHYKSLLIQIRPDFGTRIAKIYTPKHRPQIASVRPGNFEPLKENRERKGEILEFSPTLSSSDFMVVLKEIKELPKPKVDLEGAQAIVSLGLGILRDGKGNPRNPLEAYNLAEELAKAIREKFGLRTEIGATRALIYSELKELRGLITKENQVGQTGKTVSPEIYIALGISGAVQHRVGMIRSKRIIAINTDPNAPIFQVAHYGIIGDIYEEVPKLIEAIRRG
ncbi:MAG: electron transfer flavoprotein subunit alpha/FixB family protein [Nitrososphaerales archaeon]